MEIVKDNIDSKFSVNINTLIQKIKYRKDGIKRILINKFEKNIDYIIKQDPKNKWGGSNDEEILLTNNCSELILLQCSYFNRKELAGIPNITYVKRFLPKETEILDFIVESFNNIYEVKREFIVDNYRIDLYIEDLNLAIECDEYNHKDRNTEDEINRQKYIEDTLSCQFIRFNPDDKNFKISKLMNDILSFKINQEQEIIDYENDFHMNYSKNLDELQEDLVKSSKYLINLQNESLNLQNESLNLQNIGKLLDIFKDDKNGLFKALELNNLKIKENIQEIPKNIQEIPKNIQEIPQEIPQENPQNQIDIQEFETEEQPESHNNSYGPKVQIYKVDDLTKVHRVFDGITEATRSIENTSYTHIKFAAKNKLAYVGYRWNLIDRHDKYANEPKDIGTTKESITRRIGYVAMLDINKKVVEKVFGLQKDAAEFISQQVSAVCTAIKYSRPLNGNYWMLWDDVNNELKNAYLANNQLPKIETKSRGVSVQQIDVETNKVIRIFKSISDVCKEFKMSPKTIKSASLYDESHNGYKWKLN